MADSQHQDIFWRALEYGGWVVGSVVSLLGGWLLRRYRKDRAILIRLQREMGEVNEIRDAMEDGDVPLAQISDLESKMAVVSDSVSRVERKLGTLKTDHDRMATSLAKVEVNVDWLCDLWRNDRPQ